MRASSHRPLTEEVGEPLGLVVVDDGHTGGVETEVQGSLWSSLVFPLRRNWLLLLVCQRFFLMLIKQDDMKRKNILN